MDEQFDKILTSRIREVFEDYEHLADADAGWKEFRKKFPEPEKGNKKVALLWWSSVAAILMIFAGIGLWVKNQDTPVKNYANNRVNKQRPIDNTVKTEKINPVDSNSNSANTNQSDILKGNTDQQNIAEQRSAKNTKRQQPANDPLNNNNYFNNNAAPYAANVTKPVTQFRDEPVVSKTVAGQNPVIANQSKENVIDNTPVVKAKTDSPVVVNSAAIAQQTPNKQPENANKAGSMAKQQQPKSIIELLEAEKQSTPQKKEPKTRAEDKRVNFSVYAATYFNYAEGSTNQINAGAGFTSDIKLSRNIKLSTGVALAQNTLRYNSSVPKSENGSSLAFAAPSIQRADLFSANVSVPVFKNYNANLVGLDVPINIKYEFNPEKSDTYISAGLSSGTFIDEKYTYSYTYSNSTSAVQDATTTNSFNSFYFGKTLNVSFGVGYPLGKSNRLIIEPFLKYPLDGLGAQQLRFGAGGLNLKINFKSSKK
jgi:hypothetical protein